MYETELPAALEPNEPAVVVQAGASDTVSKAVELLTALPSGFSILKKYVPSVAIVKAALILVALLNVTVSACTIAPFVATAFSKVSGTFPGGVTINNSGVISGTESSSITSDTTYSFTIRATDAEGQTADRAFSITITVSINNSGGFN